MYQIKSILHTGTKGEAGTDRDEESYRNIVGRCVDDFGVNRCGIGASAWFAYVDSSDQFGIRTSLVTGIDRPDVDTVVLTTLNSVYTLKKVR